LIGCCTAAKLVKPKVATHRPGTKVTEVHGLVFRFANLS
jgi:hypothetical protein